jgi:hypothetical protein
MKSWRKIPKYRNTIIWIEYSEEIVPFFLVESTPIEPLQLSVLPISSHTPRRVMRTWVSLSPLVELTRLSWHPNSLKCASRGDTLVPLHLHYLRVGLHINSTRRTSRSHPRRVGRVDVQRLCGVRCLGHECASWHIHVDDVRVVGWYCFACDPSRRGVRYG